jgi:hypothetical protein
MSLFLVKHQGASRARFHTPAPYENITTVYTVLVKAEFQKVTSHAFFVQLTWFCDCALHTIGVYQLQYFWTSHGFLTWTLHNFLRLGFSSFSKDMDRRFGSLSWRVLQPWHSISFGFHSCEAHECALKKTTRVKHWFQTIFKIVVWMLSNILLLRAWTSQVKIAHCYPWLAFCFVFWYIRVQIWTRRLAA